jgi:hypothetical protein
MFFTSKKKITGDQPAKPTEPPSTPPPPPSSDTDAKDAASPPPEDTTAYPSGLKLALLIASIFVSLFLISLDRLIVATAIPAITNEFNSVKDIGWYGSAYLLTNAAFQLMFGKVYTFFSVKGTFLISIFLFEVGSAMCGAAPGSEVFIVARGIQGLGAAGIMAGSVSAFLYIILVETSWGRLTGVVYDYRLCRAVGEAADVSGHDRSHFWDIVCLGPACGRRVHDERHLEMVLLH